MTAQADGFYDRTKPWTRPPQWSYSGPNDSLQERRVQEALAAVTESGADLTEIVRPPLDMIEIFRPRFGYRTRVIGIQDVIDIGRAYQRNPANYSGTDAGQQGSARDSWGSGMW